MAIKGSLEETSIQAVAKMLSSGTKTGLLSVTDRENIGNIYFKDGKIVYSSMLNRELRIGDILVRAGEVTREQIIEALEKQRVEPEKRLGEILFEMGAISAETLKSYIIRQIEDTLFHLLTWRDGHFNFEQGLLPESELITVSIDPEGLIEEETGRVREWAAMKEKLPPGNAILEVVPKDSVDVQLSPEEREILSLIDGTVTLDDVVERSGFGAFKTLKALHSFFEMGVIIHVGAAGEELPEKSRRKLAEHINFGFAFFRTDLLQEAKRELNRAIEIDPRSAEANFYLGLIEYRESDYEGAAQRFRRARAAEPLRGSVLNNLGMALERLGKIDDAEEAYVKACEVVPDDPVANLNLGALKWRKGSLDEAEAALKRAVEKDEEMVFPYFLLSLIYLERGDHEEAIEWLRRGIERGPEIPCLHHNLGALLEESGDSVKAEEEYRRAIELDPYLPSPRRNLGELAYQKGNYEMAAEEFEFLVEKEAADFDLFVKLGDIYYERGNAGKAIDVWKKARELEPDNPAVIQKLEQTRTE